MGQSLSSSFGFYKSWSKLFQHDHFVISSFQHWCQINFFSICFSEEMSIFLLFMLIQQKEFEISEFLTKWKFQFMTSCNFYLVLIHT